MKSWIIRKDEKAVSPVIATILMVAITVVLAAVLYVMVTGLLAGPGATKPQVTFGQPDAVTNGFEFEVAGVTQTKDAANYRVAFSANGTTVGTAATLATSMTFGAYTIAWTDLGGENDLTGGDRFRVTRTGGLPPQTNFVVSLLWSDGSSVGSRAYSA
jgi:flagellin-like protein